MSAAELTPMGPEVVAAVLAAMYVFTSVGVQKRVLQWKYVRRICPSCHLDTRDCRCRAERRRKPPVRHRHA